MFWVAGGPRDLKPARIPHGQVMMTLEFSSGAYEQFTHSMQIDYEKWHDGTGYDLDALESADEEDLGRIEQMLVTRLDSGSKEWRDIEALDAIDTPPARAAIERAFENSGLEQQLEILVHAPESVSDQRRTEVLVEALRSAGIFKGLTQALLVIEDFHPDPVIEALKRATRERPEIAIHTAAMLAYVHGKAELSFDWNLRPLFLRFAPDETEAERAAAYRELMALIGAR